MLRIRKSLDIRQLYLACRNPRSSNIDLILGELHLPSLKVPFPNDRIEGLESLCVPLLPHGLFWRVAIIGRGKLAITGQELKNAVCYSFEIDLFHKGRE